MFSGWRDLTPQLEAAAASPLAAEALPAGQTLGELGAAGLEAVEYLGRGARPPEGWLARVTPVLDRADGPLGLLRLPFAPALRRLVVAAGAGMPARPTSP
jgi:hypothetical protein